MLDHQNASFTLDLMNMKCIFIHSQYIFHSGHAVAPVYNITQTWHIINKGTHMNTHDIYHLYKETKKGNHINDKNTITENYIYIYIYI